MTSSDSHNIRNYLANKNVQKTALPKLPSQAIQAAGANSSNESLMHDVVITNGNDSWNGASLTDSNAADPHAAPFATHSTSSYLNGDDPILAQYTAKKPIVMTNGMPQAIQANEAPAAAETEQPVQSAEPQGVQAASAPVSKNRKLMNRAKLAKEVGGSVNDSNQVLQLRAQITQLGIDDKIDEVKDKFGEVKKDQGWMGHTANWVKGVFGNSNSESAVDKDIEGLESVKAQIEGALKDGDTETAAKLTEQLMGDSEDEKKPSINFLQKRVDEYKESQDAWVENMNLITAGVVATVAIAAAPFTGGTSLGLLAAVGTGVVAGGVTAGALSWSDDATDSNGTNEWGKTGRMVVEGAIVGGTAAIGGAVGGTVSRQVSTAGLRTGLKQSFTRNAWQRGAQYTATAQGRAAGAMTQGMVDGGLSGFGVTMVKTDGDISSSLLAGGYGVLLGGAAGGIGSGSLSFGRYMAPKISSWKYTRKALPGALKVKMSNVKTRYDMHIAKDWTSRKGASFLQHTGVRLAVKPEDHDALTALRAKSVDDLSSEELAKLVKLELKSTAPLTADDWVPLRTKLAASDLDEEVKKNLLKQIDKKQAKLTTAKQAADAKSAADKAELETLHAIEVANRNDENWTRLVDLEIASGDLSKLEGVLASLKKAGAENKDSLKKREGLMAKLEAEIKKKRTQTKAAKSPFQSEKIEQKELAERLNAAKTPEEFKQVLKDELGGSHPLTAQRLTQLEEAVQNSKLLTDKAKAKYMERLDAWKSKKVTQAPEMPEGLEWGISKRVKPLADKMKIGSKFKGKDKTSGSDEPPKVRTVPERFMGIPIPRPMRGYRVAHVGPGQSAAKTLGITDPEEIFFEGGLREWADFMTQLFKTTVKPATKEAQDALDDQIAVAKFFLKELGIEDGVAHVTEEGLVRVLRSRARAALRDEEVMKDLTELLGLTEKQVRMIGRHSGKKMFGKMVDKKIKEIIRDHKIVILKPKAKTTTAAAPATTPPPDAPAAPATGAPGTGAPDATRLPAPTGVLAVGQRSPAANQFLQDIDAVDLTDASAVTNLTNRIQGDMRLKPSEADALLQRIQDRQAAAVSASPVSGVPAAPPAVAAPSSPGAVAITIPAAVSKLGRVANAKNGDVIVIVPEGAPVPTGATKLTPADIEALSWHQRRLVNATEDDHGQLYVVKKDVADGLDLDSRFKTRSNRQAGHYKKTVKEAETSTSAPVPTTVSPGAAPIRQVARPSGPVNSPEELEVLVYRLLKSQSVPDSRIKTIMSAAIAQRTAKPDMTAQEYVIVFQAEIKTHTGLTPDAALYRQVIQDLENEGKFAFTPKDEAKILLPILKAKGYGGLAPEGAINKARQAFERDTTGKPYMQHLKEELKLDEAQARDLEATFTPAMTRAKNRANAEYLAPPSHDEADDIVRAYLKEQGVDSAAILAQAQERLRKNPSISVSEYLDVLRKQINQSGLLQPKGIGDVQLQSALAKAQHEYLYRAWLKQSQQEMHASLGTTAPDPATVAPAPVTAALKPAVTAAPAAQSASKQFEDALNAILGLSPEVRKELLAFQSKLRRPVLAQRLAEDSTNEQGLRNALIDVREHVLKEPKLNAQAKALLEKMGVYEIPTPPGSAFDDTSHISAGRVETDDPNLVGQIHEVRFLGYRDREGNVIKQPEVVVYAKVSPADTGWNDGVRVLNFKNAKDENINVAIMRSGDTPSIQLKNFDDGGLSRFKAKIEKASGEVVEPGERGGLILKLGKGEEDVDYGDVIHVGERQYKVIETEVKGTKGLDLEDITPEKTPPAATAAPVAAVPESLPEPAAAVVAPAAATHVYPTLPTGSFPKKGNEFVGNANKVLESAKSRVEAGETVPIAFYRTRFAEPQPKIFGPRAQAVADDHKSYIDELARMQALKAEPAASAPDPLIPAPATAVPPAGALDPDTGLPVAGPAPASPVIGPMTPREFFDAEYPRMQQAIADSGHRYPESAPEIAALRDAVKNDPSLDDAARKLLYKKIDDNLVDPATKTPVPAAAAPVAPPAAQLPPVTGRWGSPGRKFRTYFNKRLIEAMHRIRSSKDDHEKIQIRTSLRDELESAVSRGVIAKDSEAHLAYKKFLENLALGLPVSTSPTRTGAGVSSRLKQAWGNRPKLRLRRRKPKASAPDISIPRALSDLPKKNTSKYTIPVWRPGLYAGILTGVSVGQEYEAYQKYLKDHPEAAQGAQAAGGQYSVEPGTNRVLDASGAPTQQAQQMAAGPTASTAMNANPWALPSTPTPASYYNQAAGMPVYQATNQGGLPNQYTGQSLNMGAPTTYGYGMDPSSFGSLDAVGDPGEYFLDPNNNNIV